MAGAVTNTSFDGSPVQFRMDSALLAWFDPIVLDMLGDLLLQSTALDLGEVLERANVNYPALACVAVSDFRPGIYTLDPHDIKKFGDEYEEFDYGNEETNYNPAGKALIYPFAAVNSGALIVADVGQLPKLVRLLTWKQYDLSLQEQDDAVLGKIVEVLGGPYFAVIHGGCMPGTEFDGDGTYTISVGRLKWVRS